MSAGLRQGAQPNVAAAAAGASGTKRKVRGVSTLAFAGLLSCANESYFS